VTASRVLFDTWAWWEVLRGTAEGARLQERYLDTPGVEVLTSAISLGELSAKLSSQNSEDSIPLTMSSIRHSSTVVDLNGELAVAAGVLRTQPRKRSRTASLADAIVLATARQNGARVVSRDRDLAGEPDVTSD
jgi:predicted nucleic acid-binding protein